MTFWRKPLWEAQHLAHRGVRDLWHAPRRQSCRVEDLGSLVTNLPINAIPCFMGRSPLFTDMVKNSGSGVYPSELKIEVRTPPLNGMGSKK